MVERRESPPLRGLRTLWFLLCVGVACAILWSAAGTFTSASSPLTRYRGAPQPPRVFVRGAVRASPGSSLPPLCIVQHEHYGRCGKSSCWQLVEGMATSQAVLDVAWSSSPVPAEVGLAASYRIEPLVPQALVVQGERRSTWTTRAQQAGLGFSDESLAGSNERVVERCVGAGEALFVEGCLSGSRLGPCDGERSYGIVRGGDPQPAIDAAADSVAMRVGGAFLVLLAGMLGLLRKRGPLVDALADRSNRPKKRRVFWLLLAVPPAAFVFNLLLHTSRPPSTWASGRGGFVLATTAIVACTIFARLLLLHRATIAAALAPVLSTPRSLLAKATGTVELAVRAKKSGDGVSPVLGDDVVAFAEAKITETYRTRKNSRTIRRGTIRPQDELHVIDESGDGVLDLSNAILDVEVRKGTFVEAPPRIAASGRTLERHEDHMRYSVEERVVRDGETLYVFGDVSAVDLRPDERGYRTVRGSPTLGGGGAPLLVYSGDERGLVSSLEAEARRAHRLAVAAACVAGLLSAAITFLVWL